MREALLPFPLERRTAESEEYVIPQEAKLQVLSDMYPFESVPSLEERRFDLHADKTFVVGDFKVVRENDTNYLVSPYYYEDGGTVVDWMPEDWPQ